MIDIAFLEKRHELVDDRVHRCAGLDHDHRLARALQRADKLLHRARRAECFSLRFSRGEFIGDFSRPVEDSDLKALRFHVEDEIFAHHSETDEADITLIRVHFKYLLNSSPCRSRQSRAGYPVLKHAWQLPFAKSRLPQPPLQFRPRQVERHVGRLGRFLGSSPRRWRMGSEIYRDRVRSASTDGATPNAEMIAEAAADQVRPGQKLILQHRIGFVAGRRSVDCRPRGRAPIGRPPSERINGSWIELKKKVPIWKHPLFVRQRRRRHPHELGESLTLAGSR